MKAPRMAVASFIIGIAAILLALFFYHALVLGVPAIICGHAALRKIKRTTPPSGKRMAAAGLSLGYIGIVMLLVLIFFVFPALARARARAEKKLCLVRLKYISEGVHLWASDHQGALASNFLEMTNELVNPEVLICPADPYHKEISPWLQEPWSFPIYIGHKWNPTNVSYNFLTPGANLASLSNQVIIRCPIHGNELLGDGTMRVGNLLSSE